MPSENSPQNSEKARRLPEQLLTYWHSLEALNARPGESQINPDDLSEIWANCFMVNLKESEGHKTYHYDFIGTELIDAYGQDMTGYGVAETGMPQIEALLGSIEQVKEKGEPLVHESIFVNIDKMEVRCRYALAPLWNNGKIDRVIGCISWKWC